MNLIRKKLITILIGVLFTLISHQTASAYYDPGVQRWINRDPIGVAGGVNLYGYVRNDPVSYRDSYGFSVEFPAGTYGKVRCDGRGHWKDYYPKNPRKSRQCDVDHEQQHLEDVNKAFPNACEGRAEGENPLEGPEYDGFWCDSECKAYTKGLKCRRELLCDSSLTSKEREQLDLERYSDELNVDVHCNHDECVKMSQRAREARQKVGGAQ